MSILYPSQIDPIKQFIYRTWHGINARTVNGLRPDWKSISHSRYLRKGIEIRFTYPEVITWIMRRKHTIIKLIAQDEIPSIDRIDSNGHYELPNMRIISLRKNRKAGSAAGKQNCLAKRNLMQKNCLYCAGVMRPKMYGITGNKYEQYSEFSKRETCNRTCRSLLRGQKWKSQ